MKTGSGRNPQLTLSEITISNNINNNDSDDSYDSEGSIEKRQSNHEQIDINETIKKANALLVEAREFEAYTVLKEAYQQNKYDSVLLNELGKIFLRFGYPKRALRYFEKGLLYSQLDSAIVNKEIQRKLYSNLGLTNKELGNISASYRYNVQALNLAKIIYPKNSLYIPRIENNMSFLHCATGEFVKALSLSKRAKKTVKKHHDPKEAEYNNVLADCHHSLGNTYVCLGEYKKALLHYQKALTLFAKVEQDARNTYHAYNLSDIHNGIASIYREQGNSQFFMKHCVESARVLLKSFVNEDKAEEIIDRSLSLIKQFKEKNNNVNKIREEALNLVQLYARHKEVAKVFHNFGNLFFDLGELSTARFFFQKALFVTQEIYGENHPEVAKNINSMGNISYENGNFELALKYYEEVYLINTSVYGDEHPIVAINLKNKAKVLLQQDKFQESLEICQKALQIMQKFYLNNHPRLAMLYNELGEIHQGLGNLTVALSYHEQALNILKEKLGDENYKLAKIYNNIGKIQRRSRNVAEAVKNHEAAYNITIKMQESVVEEYRYKYQKELSACLYLKGRAHEEENDFDKAKELYLNALKFEPRNIHAQKSLKSIETIRNVFDPSFEITTDFEYAKMCALAYKDKPEKFMSDPSDYRYLSKDWKVFCTSLTADDKELTEESFFAVAFINEKRKEIVFSYRGSEFSPPKVLSQIGMKRHGDIGADMNLFLNKVHEQNALAEKFYKLVCERLRQQNYPIDTYRKVFTGHSLGGALAGIRVYEETRKAIRENKPKPFAVMIDSPGVRDVINELTKSSDLNDEQVDAISYLAEPNLVNTAKGHIGKVLCVTSLKEKPSATTSDKAIYHTYNVTSYLSPLTAVAAPFVPPGVSRAALSIASKGVRDILPQEVNKVINSILSSPEGIRVLRRTAEQHGIKNFVNAFDPATGLIDTEYFKVKLVEDWPQGILQLLGYQVYKSGTTGQEEYMLKNYAHFVCQDYNPCVINKKEFNSEVWEILNRYLLNKGNKTGKYENDPCSNILKSAIASGMKPDILETYEIIDSNLITKNLSAEQFRRYVSFYIGNAIKQQPLISKPRSKYVYTRYAIHAGADFKNRSRKKSSLHKYISRRSFQWCEDNQIFFFDKKSSQRHQRNWNCGDVALEIEREWLLQELAKKENIQNDELRQLLAPEIMTAAAISVVLETEEVEQQKKLMKCFSLYQVLEKDPEEQYQLEMEINKILSDENITALTQHALPKEMYNDEVKKWVLCYQQADNDQGVKRLVNDCNTLLGYEEGNRLSFQQLCEFFKDEKNAGKNSKAYLIFENELKPARKSFEQSLIEYVLKQETFTQYIKKYYEQQGWMIYIPQSSGKNNTSIFDVVAYLKKYTVYIFQEKNGALTLDHKTENYGPKKIFILYNGIDHFFGLEERENQVVDEQASKSSSKDSEVSSNQESPVTFQATNVDEQKQLLIQTTAANAIAFLANPNFLKNCKPDTVKRKLSEDQKEQLQEMIIRFLTEQLKDYDLSTLKERKELYKNIAEQLATKYGSEKNNVFHTKKSENEFAYKISKSSALFKKTVIGFSDFKIIEKTLAERINKAISVTFREAPVRKDTFANNVEEHIKKFSNSEIEEKTQQVKAEDEILSDNNNIVPRMTN